eukprot:COSAG02_NODE_15060_length_1209_cov_0.681081_2_plen_34_part_00
MLSQWELSVVCGWVDGWVVGLMCELRMCELLKD